MNKAMIRLLAVLALLVAAVAASAVAWAQETRVVTPPGSTTRVTTSGDETVISVTVNNEAVEFVGDTRPMMLSGRVMVPLRGVVERLGGNILYDKKTRVVTGAHPGTSNQFRIRVGSNEALLNGKNMSLDAPPRVIGGTTYVPLRFVSEAMGAQVSWDNARRTVVIEADGNTATVKTGG